MDMAGCAGFVVSDTNGENPHAAIVSHITNSNPAIVTVPNDEQALNLSRSARVYGLLDRVPIQELRAYSIRSPLTSSQFHFGRSLNQYRSPCYARL